MTSIDVLFLAGGPRRPPLVELTGWPLSVTPLTDRFSMLDAWQHQVALAARGSEGVRLARSMVLVSSEFDKDLLRNHAGIEATLEPRQHRGTAGAIRDCLDVWGPGSETVLVIEISALPAVDLGLLIDAWTRIEVEAPRCMLGSSVLGRYCGVMLCARSAFELVSTVGFVDLKEQFLPSLRQAGGVIDSVTVAERARRIRAPREWTEAIGLWSAAGNASGYGSAPVDSPSHRNLIRGSATVDDATILHSIVMDEAVVEPGAIVARSVIGPGMSVRSGTRVIDAVIADPAVGHEVLLRSISKAGRMENGVDP